MLDWFTPPKFSVSKPQPMFNTTATYFPPQCNLPGHDALSTENNNLKNAFEVLKNINKDLKGENNTLKLRISDYELDISEKIKEIEKLKKVRKISGFEEILLTITAISFIFIFSYLWYGVQCK